MGWRERHGGLQRETGDRKLLDSLGEQDEAEKITGSQGKEDRRYPTKEQALDSVCVGGPCKVS